MKNILIHGLGQDEKAWNKVIEELNDVSVGCPNLFSLVKSEDMNYKKLYEAFSSYCNNKEKKLNLCGLSLGGILAIDYAKQYPDKVNSLIIIGTPYEIPKKLFKLQNIVFKFMPKSTFTKMGCEKKSFIELVNSMADLDIKSNLDKIECKTLVLCGENDKTNLESSRLLYEHIKNSELEIIENSMHEVNIDNPKELSNIICKFWEDDEI